jgi:glycosyltransferase involved in cell wall biosynthesis
MVLPLKSTQIPCGHVTIVAAMHLGKAFIVTNSIGVKDYVIDDYNAISCEASNVDILADKIQQLWQEPEKAQILGENGYKFAQENCVEEVALNHLCNLLKEKELLRD